MNAIELLESQHRDVEQLFDDIEEADEAQKRELFESLADALAVHTMIEEQIFYPETKDARTEDQLREAVEEHLSAKRLLADLLRTSPSDDGFDAKIKVLREQIDHHVEEEEESFFPEVEAFLGDERLEELGEQMESLAGQLLEGEPRRSIPSQTDAPAPLE